MTKTKAIILCIVSALLASVAVAVADYSYTQGSGTTVFAYTCFSTKVCPTQVISNSSGTEVGTASNQFQVGSPASGFADGWNVTEGTKADAAYTSGSGSMVSVLKGIYTSVSAALPLGTSGGITPLKLNALTNTAVAIKASAGQLFMLQCGNTTANEQYVQIFNIASGSVSVGSSTPTLSIPIAATSTGGFALSAVGLQFGTAISAAATTTATGGSAPGSALDCNVGYN